MAAALLALLSAVRGGIGTAAGEGYAPLELGMAVVWVGVAFGIHRRVTAVAAAALALVVLTRVLPAVIFVQPEGIVSTVLAAYLFWGAFRTLRALPRPAGAIDAG
jgi:hypothetical protein